MWGAPAVNEAVGRIYVASYDSRLYALDASTGALQWTTTPTVIPLGPVRSPLSLFVSRIYVHTLTQWVRRLDAAHTDAVKLVGEVAYRIFRIYMAGATLGFKGGVYNLNQTLFAKPIDGAAGLPLRRADWYAARG